MTEKYYLGRGKGKTTVMLARSAATKAPIVCYSRADVVFLKQKAMLLGLNIPSPITFSGLHAGIRLQNVLIDNADAIIQSLIESKTGAKVIGMTFSIENQ